MEREVGQRADDPSPPDGVKDWVRGIIGPFQTVSRYAHDHNYSELWRLRTDGSSGESAYFWVKCHRHAGKWAGEVNALANWAGPLALPAPRLLGYSDEPQAALLTEVAGVVADSLCLDDRAERRLWLAAGEFARSLHTLTNDWLGAANPDGTPQGDVHRDPEAFVRRSIESRRTQGREAGLFDAAECAFIEYGAREWPAALQGETARAVHRDYSPRNWMADETGTLHGVIDFEHARWDVRAADLYRWWDYEFLEKPYLADAFFDGYLGGKPDDRLMAQIRTLRLLGTAGGMVWATQVGDAPFAQRNRDALHRLMADGSKGQ